MTTRKTKPGPVHLLRKLALLTLPALLLLVLILELLLRFGIPASEMPFVRYDEHVRIIKYDPDVKAHGVYTMGQLGREHARWRINNDGWNSAIDYVPPDQRARPLIAIIGDSYVEALQTDVEAHLDVQLGRLLEGRFDVYSFGMSGAPLSQYLQMSRYVRGRFAPDVFVFLVTHNDFDESLRELKSKDRFLQLTPGGGQLTELPPTGYSPDPLRRMAGHSAIVRYLLLNVCAREKLRDLFSRRTAVDADANVDISEMTSHQDLIVEATTFIVRQIRRENPDKPVVFLMDALRHSLYSGEAPREELTVLHSVLADAASTNDCHFLDLTSAFGEHYRQYGQKLNSEVDFHWNALGHRVAAEALASFVRTEVLPMIRVPPRNVGRGL